MSNAASWDANIYIPRKLRLKLSNIKLIQDIPYSSDYVFLKRLYDSTN